VAVRRPTSEWRPTRAQPATRCLCGQSPGVDRKPLPARARLLLGRIAGAYRSFNLADGNALELVADGLPATPQDLSRESLRHAPVLNISELATMWHLPIGENPDQLRQGLYQRFVPVLSSVNEPGSVQTPALAPSAAQVQVSGRPSRAARPFQWRSPRWPSATTR